MPDDRLLRASSTYLRRHALDAIDWRTWSEDLAREAAEAERPVLLVVGFEACPDCARAQRTLFTDPDLAAWLHARFLPVLVDRETRPDVDALAMQALLAIQGDAGWPAVLFLHPDLRPFTGTTGLSTKDVGGFRDILERVDGVWRTDRGVVLAAADHLRRALLAPPPAAPRADPVAVLLAAHDAARGGFGEGARFPHPAENGLLLAVAAGGDEPARRAVRRNLDAMAQGALHDKSSGGFFRATLDPDWTTARPEKLLADQAQLLALYARASCVFSGTGRLGTQAARRDVDIARTTARYLWRDLRHPDGGFCAAETEDYASEGPRDTDKPRSRRRTAARIVAWNGLVVRGLAEAGRLLGFSDWVTIAAQTADHLLAARKDGRLPRQLGVDDTGYLADHAAVADGLLALYQARPHEPRWLIAAREVAAVAVDCFRAADGSFADSDASELPIHLRRFRDDAEPSPNGLLADVLRRLALLGDAASPDAVLHAAGPVLEGAPEATSTLQQVLSARSAPFLILVGAPAHPTTVQMIRVWDQTWRPGGMLGLATGAPELEIFPMLRPRPGPQPTAYLRRHGVDLPPISSVEALERALA